jgi:hypothetical protein
MSIAEKLQIVAENTPRVYNQGLEDGKAQGGSGSYEEGYNTGLEQGRTEGIEEGKIQGYTEGHTQGVEEGMIAEQMNFWAAYTNIGKRDVCDYMFAGAGWNNNTFKPKFGLKPTRAQYMFSMTGITGDLVALCKAQGITLDFSNCTLFSNIFTNASGITRIGVIDARKQIDKAFMFIYMRSLETFDKYIVSETTQFHNNSFEAVTKLENITFEGVIAKNGLNFQWSPLLTIESLKSIINCLSATTTGLSVTLSLTAVKKAFETSEGANDGNTSEEWLNLIATKPNWTINLL